MSFIKELEKTNLKINILLILCFTSLIFSILSFGSSLVLNLARLDRWGVEFAPLYVNWNTGDVRPSVERYIRTLWKNGDLKIIDKKPKAGGKK